MVKNMKKKMLFSLFLVMLIMNLILRGNVVKAYSDDEFSIDLPSTYKSVGTNTWMKTSGEYINVNIMEPPGELKGTLDDNLEELMEELSNQSVYEKFDTKEVIDITKNNYRCAHIVAKVNGYGYYVSQYIIVSGKKAYALTVRASSKSYLSSSEAEKIVNSFTIKDYKEPEIAKSSNKSSKDSSEEFADEILHRTIIGAVSGAVLGAIIAVFYKLKNKKNA